MATDEQQHNVDPSEVDKFNQMAHRWWDKDGDFKPLHDMNPLRTNYIDKYVGLAGKQVLDIGCGGGILTESMAQRGATVTGIDMAEAPLEVAKLHALESQLDIQYQQCAAEDFAQQHPASFDAVTCLEMLEHVPQPDETILACAKLVKPGGFVFFSTINRNVKAYLMAVLGAEYILRLLPRGTHDYQKFIKPSELADWARTSELSLKDAKGITYNPITKNFRLSERDLDVNYIVCTQKL